ncbi:unnamed protein product [Caenorhabditis bovis]|uniref:Secreted protein n=1 Tax=Caenorhabditis bovis TaxID=2654633 RepID=A0A8S1EVD9_9PELO|nr:unnamed protein product [Caenorhabditis bovis]CAB3405330.1 unnamed protein product [Caenorhabditis bovis]
MVLALLILFGSASANNAFPHCVDIPGLWMSALYMDVVDFVATGDTTDPRFSNDIRCHCIDGAELDLLLVVVVFERAIRLTRSSTRIGGRRKKQKNDKDTTNRPPH